MSKRCPTGKRRYRDHEEAVRGLRNVRSKDKRERTPVRTYECPKCRGFHLTSQDVWGQKA